jgi:chromosome segregation ATPase|nr:MAG TPA: hypothetical protein [Caudoviricetes sp.]
MIRKKDLLEKINKLEQNQNNLNEKIVGLESKLEILNKNFELLENYCKEVNEGIKNQIENLFEPEYIEKDKEKAELERKKYSEEMINMYSYE